LLNTHAVLFNGQNAAWFAASSDIQVNADVPAGATSGPITVTNNFGSATTTNDFFVPGSLPYVTAITPSGGPRGTRVIINGGNFTDPVNVKFNGLLDPDAAATSRSQINATVPVGATTGPLTVTTVAGASTNTRVFYASPRLNGFTPTNGIGGDVVALTGTNFTDALAVCFANHTASFTVDATNRITAVVPPDATTGPIKILTPGGPIVSTDVFRVSPHISDFAPRWGLPGTVVRILGTSLQQASEVAFGGKAGSFTVVAATEILATVPEDAQSGPLQVTTPDGVAVSSNRFSVTGSTDLRLRLEVSAVLVTPGATVSYTIHARNFGPAAASQVRVIDTLPAGLVFDSATSDRDTCTFTNQVVTCDVGVLERSEEVTITIVGQLPNEGVFANPATVTAFEADPEPGNNSGSVSLVVVSNPSRTLSIATISDAPQVLISWPTSAVPFALQAVSSLSSSNAWAELTNAPSIIDGRNRVTNPATGESRFYRLYRP
jgi:uncharacterized repeat protein (TIGR01451 family)